jgi:hypothetical protein
MNMNLFRIYDRPCGTLLCTVACCSDSPAAALEMAMKNPFIAQQMTEDSCAFPCEEVGEW